MFQGLRFRRRKYVTAATHRANGDWVCRIRLDLAANSYDAQIDGAVEDFSVPHVREVEQPLP
jgi:hypothetical protein